MTELDATLAADDATIPAPMFAGCRCPREPERVLKRSQSEGRDVLACRRCNGVFVDAELGLRLVAVLNAGVPPHDEDIQHLACPVCRQDMRRAVPQGVAVAVEVCPKHGVWFDDGDLSLVARAAAKALGKPVPLAIEALDAARGSLAGPTAATEPAPSHRQPAPAAGWTSFERVPQARQAAPQPMPAMGRSQPDIAGRVAGTAVDAAEAVLDVAGVVTDAADTAIACVALPVELTLAAVRGVGSLFD